MTDSGVREPTRMETALDPLRVARPGIVVAVMIARPRSLPKLTSAGPGDCRGRHRLVSPTVIRRGMASFAFGSVTVRTPSSSCAAMASRSILPESVKPRA